MHRVGLRTQHNVQLYLQLSRSGTSTYTGIKFSTDIRIDTNLRSGYQDPSIGGPVSGPDWYSIDTAVLNLLTKNSSKESWAGLFF